MLQRLARTRVVAAYLTQLERYPLATKCTTSGLLMVGSDGLRQGLERQGDDAAFRWDAARTARLTAFSIAVHAPYLHWYHPFVEAIYARHGVRHTVVKVALDQALAAPPFLSLFLAYTALAEGLGVAGAKARVAQQLPVLWQDSLWCWGPAHLVTFNIPVPLRVLWQDVVRVYFGSLMSLRGNAKLRSDGDEE